MGRRSDLVRHHRERRSGRRAQTVTATTGAVNGIVTDSTQGRRAGRDGHPVRAVIDDRPDDGHRRSRRLPLFRGAARRLRDHVSRSPVSRRSCARASTSRSASRHPLTPSSAGRGHRQRHRHRRARHRPRVNEVTAHFDSDKLATLPGARDIFAVARQHAGRGDGEDGRRRQRRAAVQEYTAYGLRATTGMNRNEVEGIRSGRANGANDNYLSDFASFAEIAVKAVGHSAAMPVPGTLAQYVSKSGGNAYRGSVVRGFPERRAGRRPTSTTSQIARGVTGGPGLDVRDVNRLERFRDFNVDVGGYLKKDKAWWYGALPRDRRSSNATRGCSTRRPRLPASRRPASSPILLASARSSSATCSTKRSRSRASSSPARASPWPDERRAAHA